MKIFEFIKNIFLYAILILMTAFLTLLCIANIVPNIQETSAFSTILTVDFHVFFNLNLCIFTLSIIILSIVKTIRNNFNLPKYIKYSFTVSFVISCGLYFDLTEFIAISSFVTFCISICKFMFRDQANDDANSNQCNNPSEQVEKPWIFFRELFEI